MIWPFKRTPKITFDEEIVDKPMPPCGYKEAHYLWHNVGYLCPFCEFIPKSKQDLADEDRLAEKIAERVASKIKASTAHKERS